MSQLVICDGHKARDIVKVLNGTDYIHVPFLGDKTRYLDLCSEICAKQYWKYKGEVEKTERHERQMERSRREQHLATFYGGLTDGSQIQEQAEVEQQILNGPERSQPHRVVELESG